MKIVWLLVGTVVGGFAKLLSHYLAGIIYWTDPEWFAWGLNEMNLYLYCFVYNIAFVGPSILITGGLLTVVYLTAPKVLTNKAFVETVDNDTRGIVPVLISGFLIVAGAFLFVFFLVKWIQSFSYNAEDVKYKFDQDSMVIYVLGIFIATLGAICLASYFKFRFNYLLLASVMLVITVISLLYAAGKAGYALQADIDPTKYWIWLIVASIGFVLSEIFFVLMLLKRRRDMDL